LVKKCFLGNDWFSATLPLVDLDQASLGVIGTPRSKNTFGVKQRSKLEGMLLACELTASFAYEMKIVQF